MDADMANGKPGTLVADGEWKASAYVTGSDVDEITPRLVTVTLTVVLLEGVWRREATTQYNPADGEWKASAYVTGSDVDEITPRLVTVTLTVVLLEGVWRREATTQYNPSTLADYTDLDYPYDYEHDWSPSLLANHATNPALSPMPCRLTVYGPATDPEITIGGNTYAVDCEVPSGAYLVIDGLDRTIRLTMSNGDIIDHFPDGRRGSGLGGGEYCFQPLPAGESEVSWAGGYGFDLTVIEERGEPPWSI